MTTLIKQRAKTTGIVYVYESQSYYDAEKKQSRSKRKCIGKIDPATGEIIPTGGRAGRKKKPRPEGDPAEVQRLKELYQESQDRIAALQEYIAKQRLEIAQKSSAIQELTEKNQKFVNAMNSIQSILATASEGQPVPNEIVAPM